MISHISLYVCYTNITKFSCVSICRKESGLDRFVPASLAETMKKKELRKLLSHFLKLNAAEGVQGQDGKQPQQQMTALQVGWWTLIRTQEPSPIKSKGLHSSCQSQRRD